jgi:glucose-1-phosphate cytidylyltransferase
MSPTHNIPVFILAGGLGTRISEETHARPKPMIEIGNIPILLHIMRHYYGFGFNDFVICAGYKSWEIKNYFLNYEFRQNDLELDHRIDRSRPARARDDQAGHEKWRIRVFDTGEDCMTGGRIGRAFDRVADKENFETFAVTYGDGLCDVDMSAELAFHRKHQRIGTVLGVHPMARFGELELGPDDQVESFEEKPQSKKGCINGGFFFFNRGFREYLSAQPDCVLERSPLEKLAKDKQLMMFRHEGFWQPMDTLRDRNYLEQLWARGQAPWLRVTNDR